MLDNIEFPTYNEAEEYCRENNLSYDVIEYAGDYATININLNKHTDNHLRNYEVHYVNSDDLAAYTIVNNAVSKEQAVEIVKERFKNEIYRIVGVYEIR